jgi:hypothetical protein
LASAEWRFGRGWTERQLARRLRALGGRRENAGFGEAGFPRGDRWRRYYTQAVVGVDPPGPPRPESTYWRLWDAVMNYEHSDPGIVKGHFDPRQPLRGRDMLLEIQVLGLHYLCGTRVNRVETRDTPEETLRAWRYDTLEGHFEVGSEWFRLHKDHRTGEIRFRIHASWHPGEFPNWWSRLGFDAIGERYQLAWHRLCYLRLREIAGTGQRLAPVPHGRALVHTGAEGIESDLWILKRASPVAKVGVLGNAARALPKRKGVEHADDGKKRIERVG